LTDKSPESLWRSQLLGGVLVFLLILFSLNCGGGGGGSEVENSVSLEQNQQKTEAKIQIDLADFEILENRQKARAAGKDFSDVEKVTISVSVNGSKILSRVELQHISGTLYEVTLQDLPIGEALTLEIQAEDSRGEVIMRAISQTTLDQETSKETAPQIAIPLSAVVEFDGKIINEEDINNLINQVATEASDEEAAQIFLLRTDEFGNYIKDFSFTYKAYLKEAELTIRKPDSSNALVKISPVEFGRAGQMTAMIAPIAAATAEQITYGYDGIEAWYKKAENALEQGFTISEKPSGEGEVCVDFRIEADRVIFKGDSFLFESEDEAFRYDKLYVYDATGKTLDARFEYDQDKTIRICFSDVNASYPIVVDPSISASQIQLRDHDDNGKITSVRVLYSENIASGGNNTTGWTVTNNGVGVDILSASSGGSFINLILDSTDPDLPIDTRGNGLEVSFNANSGNLVFASGNFADNIMTGDSGASDTEDDLADPVLVDVEFTTLIAPAGMDLAGNVLNSIKLSYSENVILSLDASGSDDVVNNGAPEYSSGSLGAMTTARTLEGLISWSNPNGGDMSGNGSNVNAIVLSDNVVTVYLNARNEGYFTSGSSAPTATTVTVLSDALDLQDEAGRAVSTVYNPSESYGSAWDVTAPTVVDVLNLDNDNDGMTDALEFELSENMIDAFTRAPFIELDGDSIDDATLESDGVSVDTAVTDIAVDNDGYDEYIRIDFVDLSGRSTGNMYYRSSEGLFRDAAGNVPDFAGTKGPTRDGANPVLLSVDFTQITAPANDVSGNLVNAIDLVYSENIHLYSDGAGGGEVSVDSSSNTTTNLGSMTAARTLSGLFQWDATDGGVMQTSSAVTGTVQNISGNQVRVFFNTAIGGYFSGGSTAPSTPSVTVISNVNFVEDDSNLPVILSSSVSVINSTAWDVISPQVDVFSGLDQDNDGSLDTVQITFTDNILDESLVAALFEFDADSNNNTINETLGATGSTDFISPVDSDVHDEKYRINPASELVGTGNYYLHIIGDGVRDKAGNRLATANNVGTYVDVVGPGLLSVDFSKAAAPVGTALAGNLVNTVSLGFSEEVKIYRNGAGGSEILTGNSESSTATMGSMSTANLIAGLFSWDTTDGGDMVGLDTVNTITKSTANTLTLYLNTALTGIFQSGSSAPTTPVSTIIVDTNDLMDINGNPGNTGITPSVSNSTAWDVTPPTFASVYSLDTNTDGDIDTVDITFSENIIDNSVTPGSLELDLDQTDDGNNETVGVSFDTQVTQPSTDTDSHDDKIRITLTSALNGSANVFLHHNAAGLRDAAGNPIALGDDLGSAIDAANPVIKSIDFTQRLAPSGMDLSGNILNSVEIVYSETVRVFTDGAGGGPIATNNHAESTSDMGSMAQANLITGLISWSGGQAGNMRNNADTDNRVELSNGNVVNIYFNSQNTGYFSSGFTTAPGIPSVAAIVDSNDLIDMANPCLTPILSSSISVTNSTVWDTGIPSIWDVYSLDTNGDGDVDAVDITFSENILDDSLTVTHYEIDNDSSNNGTGEVNPNSISTGVTYPAVVNVDHDSYINFSVATPVTGSENVFLHVVSQGARDIYGNRLAIISAAGNSIDQSPPVLLEVDFATGTAPSGTEVGGNIVNMVSLGYSENIQVFSDGAGGSVIAIGSTSQSTSTQGSMISANLVTGLISWHTTDGGDLVGNFDTANAVEHATGNTINVYLNASFNGHFSGGSTAPTTPASVSAISDSSDLMDEAGLAVYASSSPVIKNTGTWDDNKPTVTQIYALDTNANGQIDRVDVVFNGGSSMIDGSFDVANFEVDNDDVNNGIGEVTPNAFSTDIVYPGPDAISDNRRVSFLLNPEIPGTEEVYLHNLQLGARDHAGNPLVVGDDVATTSTDAAEPVLLTADFTQLTAPVGSDLAGNVLNAIQLAYSENIIIHTNGAGGSDVAVGNNAATTNTMGSMAQANLLTGLMSWSGAQRGDLATSDNTVNQIELDSSGNIINVYMNASNSGYFASGTTAPDLPGAITVNAIADSNDLEDAVGLSANNSNTVVVTNSIDWDDTVPTVVSNTSLDNDVDGDVESFDVTFSENILDASFIAANFAFDDDDTNLSGNEKNATSGNTYVTKPSVINNGNDEYFHFELTNGNELVGSEAGYLHHNTLGLRDIVGNRLALGDALGGEIDCAGPVLLTVNFTSAASPATSELGGNTVNIIALGYSENVIVSNNNDGGDDVAEGTFVSSTNTMGSMTTVRDVAGLIRWATSDGGDMVNNADADNVVEHTSGNEITVYLNANYSGYFSSGTSSPSANATVNFVYSDNLDVRDSAFVAVNSLSSPSVSVTASTNSDAWDVTKPTTTISPGTTADISTYNIRTPDITYDEGVVFGTNVDLYTISLNGTFLLGATDSIFTIAAMTQTTGNTYEMTFNETTDRFKSGSFRIDIDEAIRDDAGNRLDPSSDLFIYNVEVDNVALYEFESSDTTDNYNSWTSGSFNPSLSGGASANLESTGWGIDGNAMNLYGAETFTIDGLDYHGFPQNKGTVAFWYWVPTTPSINDIVFGDLNTVGGNAMTIRYTGSDNTYRITAHGVAAGNTLDFNLVLGSYNHLALKYNHDANLRLYLNGERLSSLISTGEWFPNDQDVIWQPNGTLDHVWLNDIVRSEAEIQAYFIPLTQAIYTFESGNVTDPYVLDEQNDFLGTIYGSTNLVEGHHLTGNALALHESTTGFRPEEHGEHLFPHISTGTLQFWVNPDEVDGVNINLLDEPDPGRDHFYIRGTGNAAEYQFIIQTSAGGGTLGSTTFELQDQAWNYVGVSWDTSANLYLYVNGSANYTFPMPAGWSLGGQIIGTTPRGYLDDISVIDDIWTSTNFQQTFDQYHIQTASYSFDEGATATNINVPWLNTNDVGIYYTTDTSGNNHRMFFRGASVPTLDRPHYGDTTTTGNSLSFSGNSGFSVYSMESDFFPSEDGTYIWWWKPSFETGGNTVELLDTEDVNRNHFLIESFDSTGNYQFGLRDTSGTVSDNYIFRPVMERWNHMSITWTSNSSDHGNNPWASFFLNGVEVWDSNIGSWRPSDQKTASTPYGSLDNFRIRSYPYTSAEVLDEYDDYIRNIEEFAGINTIVYSFANGEFEATNSHDAELLFDVDTLNATQNPPAHGRFNAIHQSTTGHHGYYDDVDRPSGGIADTFDTGAQEFEAGESFWAPVLDKGRFPQDEGTLRFWFKPIYEYGDEDVVFGGNFIDANNHKNFFLIEETSNQGFYDFNIYEDGALLGGLTNFELHRNIFNYVSVTWKDGDEIDLYINGAPRNATTMGTWRPSDQIVVSTPNGVLDMLYLEDVQRDATFINDYFVTYVTAKGFYTFEMDTLPDIVDQSGSLKDASEYGPGVLVNAQGFDVSSNYYLDLTANGSYFDMPGLIKDLFPQDEGVVRFWYDPAISSDNNTYVFDEPDLDRNHFYITSQTLEGYYRFAIQSNLSSDNLGGYYDFYLDPNDWNLVSFNWSDDEDKINLMVNGKVLYTTQMGDWRPSKQISVSTPNGHLDDFYISYEYESVDEVEEYYHIYKTKMDEGSMQVWGDGSNGRLGHGVSSITDTPYINNKAIRVTTPAGGTNFGVAILENSKMITWGANDLGQLGLGNQTSTTVPTEIDLWNGFDDVDAGDRFVMATLVNGNVVGWGNNSRNQLGFTSGGTAYETSPYILNNISGVIAIACGNSHVLALLSNGDVYSWGGNDYGQCGVDPSSSITVTAPQQMIDGSGLPSPVAEIDCGLYHSLIRFDDGSVTAYGLNGDGQLGDGSTTNSFAGVSAGISGTAIDIAAGGEFSMALLNSNVVESWGKNDNGQLGGGDSTLSSNVTPIRVKINSGQDLSDVVEIAASETTGYARISGNTVHSFGKGLEGQLGNGSRNGAQEFSSNVVAVTGLATLGKPGSDHITGIVNRSSYYSSFENVDVVINFDNEDFTDLGTAHFDAQHYGSPTSGNGRSDKGLAYLFEDEEYMAISDMSGNVFPQYEGTYSFWYKASASTPTGANILDEPDLTRNHFHLQYTGLGNIDLVQTDGGLATTLGTVNVTLDDWHFLAFSWQTNSSTLIISNNGTSTQSVVSYGSWAPEDQIVISTPVGWLDNLKITSQFSDADELMDEFVFGGNSSSGEYVKAWGANSLEELGDGTTTNQFGPVDVTDINNPTQISVGLDFKIALYSDGSMEGVGENTYGQLGDGTTTDRYSPVDVINFKGAPTYIKSGKNFTVGLLADGNVIAWGNNQKGQVGINSSSSHFVDARLVSTLTDIQQIAVGYEHALALTSDGNIYSWGDNSYGQLGTGASSPAYKKVPSMVTSITGVSSISAGQYHSLALMTDGTVRSWGYNQNGQLGDGTTTNRYFPIQVNGGLLGENVTNIYAGGKFNVAIVDNTDLYIWGSAKNNSLNSTPTFLSTNANISDLAIGWDHFVVLMNTGTLMSWGDNTRGQLGLGDSSITSVSVLTAIPDLDTILSLTVVKDSNFVVGQ
jgi:alpha-tubulin suppressor-like RCC1 family protein